MKTMATGHVSRNISFAMSRTDTYDHRTLKTRLPVRSALFKQRTGGLVVRWVTTSEYPLLYVFGSFVVLSFLLRLGGDKGRQVCLLKSTALLLCANLTEIG